MGKTTKSSASSATRKKHARKAAATTGELDPPQPKEKRPKGKDKKSKNEPKKKVYVPPVKPAPPQRDPLDVLGLAHVLPPELLVVLRRFGKKDATTKAKALEDLGAGWVEVARARDAEAADSAISALVQAVPVWLHHLPVLLLHPSRRIRALSAGLHTAILRLPPIRSQVFTYLRDFASADQAEAILGGWCMAAHDIDRQTASLARSSWSDSIFFPRGQADTLETGNKLVLDKGLYAPLVSLVQRAALDPAGVYMWLNPPAPAPPPPPPGAKKGPRAPIQVKRVEEETRRADEEEERSEDRSARLRIGALGALGWIVETKGGVGKGEESDELRALLNNPALWTSLQHNRTPPKSADVGDLESFGYAQPGVRRAAWAVLQILIQRGRDEFDALLPVLSTAVLRAAWVEPDDLVREAMWAPLLTFLTSYPRAWDLDLAASHPTTVHDDDGSDEVSDDDEGNARDQPPAPAQSTSAVPAATPSEAYTELLRFLELGCSGAPVQGYPAVVVILSTIPPSVYSGSTTEGSAAEVLLVSFWAALDGRALSALDKAAAGAALLAALLDILIFFVRRAREEAYGSALFGTSAPEESARNLACEHLARAWGEISARRLHADPRIAGGAIAKAMVSFDKLSPDLSAAVWSALVVPVRASLAPASSKDAADGESGLALIRGVQEAAPTGASLEEKVKNLVRACAEDAVGRVETSVAEVTVGKPLDARSFAPLVSVLKYFGAEVWADEALLERITNVISQHPGSVLSASPDFTLTYLANFPDASRGTGLWDNLLGTIAAEPMLAEMWLAPLLDAAQRGGLPVWATPIAPRLDELVGLAVADTLDAQSDGRATLARRILTTPEPFISSECLSGVLESTAAAMSAQVDQALTDPSVPLSSFRSALNLLRAGLSMQKGAYATAAAAAWPSLLSDVFLIGFLLPECTEGADEADAGLARWLWESGKGSLPEDEMKVVILAVKERLQECVIDSSSRPSPRNVLSVFARSRLDGSTSLGLDILPGEVALDELFNFLPLNSTDPSLAVNDVLVPPDATLFEDEVKHDRDGLSSYARVATALLQVLSEDRQLARTNVWALKHILTLLVYAEDWLALRSAGRALFAIKVDKSVIQDLVPRAQQVVAYLLGGDLGDGWHKAVASAITQEKSALVPDAIGNFIVGLVKRSVAKDEVQTSRILSTALHFVLRGSDKADGDHWVGLGRKFEKTAPRTLLVILHAVSQSGAEPPRLDRYRNELAANLLGLPSSKANLEGLLALRRLVTVAPDVESDVAFLPQNRAVNLMKACQTWVASDEEIDEGVESAMTLVFLHLAPILQSVPGAHWDLIFDIMENNLEFVSFADHSTLVALARTLRLVTTVRDLCATNKALRAVWQDREPKVLSMIRDLASARVVVETPSGPLSTCRELALTIVQNLPPSLIDQNTMPSMCHLVTNSSVEVQKMAYLLLRDAAAKRTELIVIEAGVDSEGVFKPELPIELMDLLTRPFDVSESDIQASFGYLLGWMLAFDLFQDASIKVKTSYSDHLQNLGLIETHFLPAVYTLLDVYSGPKKAFKLDMWSVDEYYIQLFDADVALSLQLLAAHLYYRSLLVVPSLVRDWLAGCKDRTLLSYVTGYTSQHFSRVIIDTELARVRDPAVIEELSDENTTIKVAGAVNEITASYTVDEQTLELTLKLPPDWPLHNIEVIDRKKVAIPENRWRAWILGIQRIIWSQNGTLVDGLTFYKKNVSLHFEGMVECAICYSIIAVTDNSLPTKPCQTCKNRFHASCLYKWFNTSHSSSCPLCRSEIL